VIAREITGALRGRWHGGYGMALCPSHDDESTPALELDPPKSGGTDLAAASDDEGESER
jgi:hypothetical protein